MSFKVAFLRTVGLEAGYSNRPADRGGETKYGISKRWYPDEDIAGMTLERAQEIYHRDYWMPLRLDSVSSELVQAEIFDTAVNCGTRAAAKIIQRSLNFLGEKLQLDGVVGPITIARLNFWIEKDVRALFKCLNGFQFQIYADCVAHDPAQVENTRGWMKRIQEYNEGREK